MVHVQSFDSAEEMFAAMAQATEDANARLAPHQRDLTFGSYWVRFYDVTERIIEFGRVFTLDEIPFEPEDGYPVEVQRQEMIENTERGYLYSEANSILGTENGDTHRYNAWPIEQRLFDMAKAVDWKIDDLDDTGKLLLEIAYAGFRAHMRSQS